MPVDDRDTLDYAGPEQPSIVEEKAHAEQRAKVEADLSALNAHTDAIRALWDEAFYKPAPTEYTLGAIVWLYDHYNTGTIVGRELDGKWEVETSDSDGSVHRYSYPARDLRPALSKMVFIYPSIREPITLALDALEAAAAIEAVANRVNPERKSFTHCGDSRHPEDCSADDCDRDGGKW